MSQIYTIQFLNDLHNHFPELLYNQQRFQNIQDVLGYIRNVAEISPFNIGQQAYNNRPSNPLPATNIPVRNILPHTFVSMFEESTAPVTANNTLINTLITGLFGSIQPGNLNANFLERVSIYPTNEQINNATTTFRASRNQDIICAICQDEIEINQNVRSITFCNHYFHQDCIDTWFLGNVQCPTCRHDIREVSQNTQPSNIPPPVPENHRRMNIRRPDTN